MGRQGLNGTLSYTLGGQKYTFDVRVGGIQHGVQMVADEDTSRTRRAYYPHRLSAAPFSIQVIINGYEERTLFSNFLSDYAQQALDPNLDGQFPQMMVVVPVRNFVKSGVPLTGIEWGTHVGAFTWTTQVSFETTTDWSLGDSGTPSISSFQLSNLASSQAPELKYFYPSGVQLSGDEVPASGDYQLPVSPGDVAAIISGGTQGPSDIGDQPINPWSNKPQNPY